MNAHSTTVEAQPAPNALADKNERSRKDEEDTRVDVATSESEIESRVPPRMPSDRTERLPSMESAASMSTLGPKRQSWWERVMSFSSKRKRQEEDEFTIDHDMYMRTILESYSSSLSSNRFSSVYFPEGRQSNGVQAGPNVVRSISARRAYTDENGGVYVAQPETPPGDESAYRSSLDKRLYDMVERQDAEDEAIMEDEEEKRRRRIQRRITQDAIRKKMLQKNQHRARTRKKFTIFALCIGLTLTAFIVAAMLIANVGVKARTQANEKASESKNSTSTLAPGATASPGSRGSTESSARTPATTAPQTTVPSPLYGVGDVGSDESSISDESGSNSGSGSSQMPYIVPNPNRTSTPLTGRSGIDLLIPRTTSAPGKTSWDGKTSFTVYTYVHCLLMSLSLWLSLVVIGMHATFKSFRTYSMPLVLELSSFQTGYWITSLLRVQLTTPHMSENLSIIFCLCECFFNFGQISFTCAIAFNLYRSVVSYADVLVDTQSSDRRYRSYTINVMLLSFLASITLALVGYRNHENVPFQNFEVCLYPTCRLILYVYYPLLAFAFNFIFYVRFRRTIGGAYPMSATGRLNSVARSYLVVFFVCWGSLITLTILKSNTNVSTNVLFALQWIFDVLGVGTALITLKNYHRCRRAFDFGLSLKAIDPHSIEFEEPLQILGEGSFAIVLKAKWRQRAMEDSASQTIDVAVKTFKHTQFETLEEMKEEAYLASKLVHPCVMMTYGCYTIGNNLYILSEYLGGGTLQDVIDTTDDLGYERTLRYAHMIAMGMRFLHGLPIPIIHRDLKPLNCIFDSNQEMLKIADFGESRLFRKDGLIKQKPNFFPSFDQTLQMTTNIGSACWAAPEVLQDAAKSEYSLKVDVYSFGIICWQLYTCKVPYTDIPGSVMAVAEAVIGGHRPEIPADCPTLFSKIMRRCWHHDPLRRPSFEDIVQLLEMELSDVQNPPSEEGGSLVKTRSARRLQINTPKAT